MPQEQRAMTKQVPHLRWSQAPPLPWRRPGSADIYIYIYIDSHDYKPYNHHDLPSSTIHIYIYPAAMYFLHRRLNISVSPLSRLICSRHSAHNACAVDSPWMTGGSIVMGATPTAGWFIREKHPIYKWMVYG